MLELRKIGFGDDMAYGCPNKYHLGIFVLLLPVCKVSFFSLDLVTAPFSLAEGPGYLFYFDAALYDYFLLQNPIVRRLELFGSGKRTIDVGDQQLEVVLDRVAVLEAELARGSDFDHLKLLFSLFLLDVVSEEVCYVSLKNGDKLLIDEFKDLLESSFRYQRSTSFYASKLGLTPRRLRVVSRVWFGKGFFEVLMERLMLEAVSMLGNKYIPVKEIAYELGFSSISHFGTAFKRIKGVSPTEYRLQLITKNNATDV